MTIEGRIVRILSETEFVINVGRVDRVQSGMEFVVFVETEPILDPETGQVLGNLETLKGRLKVYHVMEHMARARTLTYKVVLPSVADQIARMTSLNYQETGVRRKSLQVKRDEVEPIAEDMVVRLGDRVRESDAE